MRRFVLRRMLVAVPTLVLTTVLIFCLRLLIPGGPAQAIAGQGAPPSAVRIISIRLGLNRPFVEQYGRWIWHAIHGNLGVSYSSAEPVREIISQRLPASVEMILLAIPIATILGGALGMWAAIRSDRFDGKAVLGLSGLGLSAPDFWLASVAAGVIGLHLGLLPAVGFTPLSHGLVQNLRSLVLPVAVLSSSSGALVCRHIRSSMARVLGTVHIRTAWAMGLRRREIYMNYALRIAIVPLITFLPLVISALIGSTVLVEEIFDIPGLGSAIVEAVSSRDYETVQGITVLIAIVVIALNFLADVLHGLLDPRVRVASNRGRSADLGSDPLSAGVAGLLVTPGVGDV